jgi:hypothetical protein
MFVETAARRPVQGQSQKRDMDGANFGRKSHLMLVLALCTFALLLVGGLSADVYAQSSTDSSVTLTWTAPGDDGSVGTATQYDLRYSLSPINASNFNAATAVTGLPSPQPAGSSESFTVPGLTPNTTYYFAIKTADENNNWSAISNIVSRATSQEAYSPSNIADLSAGSATENSITLSWTAPGDDGDVGTASQYDIRYSTSPITMANWGSATQVSGEPTPQSAGSSESFVVTGLTEGTTYYFAIRTADEVPNWSGLSNVVGHSTASDTTPPASVTDLAAITGPDYGSIALVFTSTGADGLYGMATAYEIRVHDQLITDLNWNTATLITNPPAPKPAGSSENIVIDSLAPGQTYFVGLKVWDAAGNASSISNISFAEANVDLSLGTGGDGGTLPDEFHLQQNYPNPFNPSTVIEYDLPQATQVNLSIYNVHGQHVKTLAQGEQVGGTHQVTWNGDNDEGARVATGVYFYRLMTTGFSETKKMVFVK